MLVELTDMCFAVVLLLLMSLKEVLELSSQKFEGYF